jgi:hypothetical protein
MAKISINKLAKLSHFADNCIANIAIVRAGGAVLLRVRQYRNGTKIS